jgi:shikimate kinase
MHLILFGFQGCGKTTIGKLFAEQLRRPFIDTDARIEALSGLPVRELCRIHGETHFRALEKQIILELEPRPDAVIALGGGSVLDSQSVQFLRTIGQLIYLEVPFEQLHIEGLPAYTDGRALYEIYQARKPIYEAVARGL